jgi:L-ribulokinase
VATTTCTVGLDFGTGSARAIAVDTSTGAELATSIYEYPHGVVEDAQDPNVARQEPSDYVAALEATLSDVASEVAQAGGRIVGIGAATTGSTPLPVDADGVALGVHEEWASESAAKAWLWKDHTSFAEAAEITDVP